MTAYPPALATHFAREVTTICHCWRMTRKDGTVTGYTDHDRRLVIEGLVFEPETGFAASEARDTLGLAVDTVDVRGVLSSDRIREEDIAAGLYDGARVETLLVNWRDAAGFAVVRTATIGRITRSDDGFVAELESLVHALDQPSGRYVTRSCDAEVGDTRCGFLLSQDGFTAAGTVVTAGETLRVSGLDDYEAGWFSYGTLTWTSGARAGRSERIAGHRRDGAGTVIVLLPSVGPAILPGDAFTATAGCDKTFATCKAKFSNALNFRGFPHLPGNDAAYSYVADGGAFDGGPVVP